MTTTTDDPTALNRYLVSYRFDEQRCGGHRDAIERVRRAVAELQRAGVEIRFLGATRRLDAAGGAIDLTVRYGAPTKGTIGRLNCRARLPASGAPRRTRRGDPESTGPQSAAVPTR